MLICLACCATTMCHTAVCGCVQTISSVEIKQAQIEALRLPAMGSSKHMYALVCVWRYWRSTLPAFVVVVVMITTIVVVLIVVIITLPVVLPLLLVVVG